MDSPVFLLLLDQRGNRFRLTDNLDSGRVDNIPDIPRLSTNEKAVVGGMAAKSGRISFLTSDTNLQLCGQRRYNMKI